MKLIDMSIKLDNLTFPEDDLKKLKKEFKSNPICDRLIRHLVVPLGGCAASAGK